MFQRPSLDAGVLAGGMMSRGPSQHKPKYDTAIALLIALILQAASVAVDADHLTPQYSLPTCAHALTNAEAQAMALYMCHASTHLHQMRLRVHL